MVGADTPIGRRWRETAVAVATVVAAAMGLVAVGFVAMGFAATPAGAQVPVDDDVRELAERHAPVIMLKAQDGECDDDGEPYTPISVEAVLGNPQIALRQVGRADPVVMWGPEASDLFGLGEGFYLDFPGSALDPGCLYERDNRRFTEGLEPTVYAHVVIQEDRPDVVALQYWFYWYFNDWNNKHESDWEGIQLLFEASSPAEALAVEPYEVGYAQHEGGERKAWDSDGLERDGDRPVVYSSARSHASYFSESLYLGRGASEGFGCDDTDGPSTRVDPDVVVLPSSVDDPDDPLAWLAYDGRWGERLGGPFNGPTGLLHKGRWTHPVDWQDDLRENSVLVPAGESAARGVIDGFCAVVEWGSQQVIALQQSPTRIAIVVGLLALMVWAIVRRTTWDPTPPSPIVRRRHAGQILTTAWSRFRSAPGVFLMLGALSVPIAIVVGIAVAIVRRLPLFGTVLDLADTGGGSRLVLALVGGGVGTALAFWLVIGAVGWTLEELDRGDRPDVRRTLEAVGARWKSLARAFVRVVIVVVVPAATILGAPLAVWLLVRRQLAAQAVVLGGVDGAAAPARSVELTRGRWWRTFLITGTVNVVVLGGGFVVALLALVVFTSLPLWALSIVVMVVGAAVMPIGAVALVYLYGDAVAAEQEAALVAPGTSPDTLTPA